MSRLFALALLATLTACTPARADGGPTVTPTATATRTPAPTATPWAPPACRLTDCNCADFRTGHEAQRFFEWSRENTGQRDRHRLDADGDGWACEFGP